jgi:ribose transport system substrate-binding protein
MRLKALGVIGLVVVAAAVVAACGSSSGTSSSGGSTGATASAEGCPPGVKEKLEAKLEQFEAIPKFAPPGPAFDASKAQGKTVFNIPLLSTDTFNQIVDKASAKAAEEAGVKFIEYTNQGEPSQWVAGMNQAISQNADLIILEGGPDPAALGPQLEAAKKAGIPVISTHRFDADAAAEMLKKYGLAGIVPAQHYLGSGELTADYAMVSSGCNVNALVLEADDVQPTSAGITARFEEELSKSCPESCKAQAISMPFGDWAQKASGEMQSKLTADPEINFIAPNFDQGAIYARQAILAAGADSRVKIVAYNGSAPVMQMLQDGESVISEVGEPMEWLGWQNMDQALRILSGVKPTEAPTPVRLFDASNISEAGEPVVQTKGYGPSSQYEEGFRTLWGLK